MYALGLLLNIITINHKYNSKNNWRVFAATHPQYNADRPYMIGHEALAKTPGECFRPKRIGQSPIRFASDIPNPKGRVAENGGGRGACIGAEGPNTKPISHPIEKALFNIIYHHEVL
jgi:hypothetical protein